MSYTPTQWATGDVVTAEKLNNMETGIYNANNTLTGDKVIDIYCSINSSTGEIETQDTITYNEALGIGRGDYTLRMTFGVDDSIIAYGKPIDEYLNYVILAAKYYSPAENLHRDFTVIFRYPDDETQPISFVFLWDTRSDPFVVTLTPTAQDYSGTMDKTVSEINAAYEAGRKIVFKVMVSFTQYMMVDCTTQIFGSNTAYPAFNAYIVDNGSNIIIFASTGLTDDGTKQTYSTTIFPLTPMS